MNAYQTPCRPRAARVAKPQGGHGDRPQDWTASRCHRLLRPLKARIASLRKDVQLKPHAPSSGVAAGDRAESQLKRPAQRDCDWMVAPKKRVRRTYSGRRTNQPEPRPLDGDGASSKFAAAKTLATPLLRRARGQHVPSSPIQELEGEPSRTTGRSALELRLQSFQPELSPARYNDYEAVFKTLEALLQATRTEKRPRKGASSFMDMCLRKVPQHIAVVEAWDAAQAEEAKTKSMIEDSHTSFQIYTELESLGTSHYGGWKHLRTVVRADALGTIQDAMLEGLFTKEFSILLLDLCFACAASAEVEPVFSALLNRPFPFPSSPDATLSENDALLPLAYLCDAKSKPRRSSFLLRQCSDMLSKGCLPVEWLGTPNFERLWELANRSLSRRNAGDAAHFIITSVALLCRKWRPGERGTSQDLQQVTMAAVQNALTSALALQAVINIISEGEAPASDHAHPNCHQGVAHIRRISKYILEASIAEVGRCGARRDRPGGNLLGVAAFFSSTPPGDDRTSLGVAKFITAISSQQIGAKRDRTMHQYDAMISLIASIARICGRVTSRACHGHLETLSSRLGQLGLQPGVLDSINTAAALTLAQQTNSLRDQIYAENLASNMPDVSSAGHGQGQGQGPQTHTLSMFAGYRWEDTIGEWVAAAASPAAAKRNQPAAGRRSSRLSSSSNNDNNTCRRITNTDQALPRRSTRADVGPTQTTSFGPQPTKSYGLTSSPDAVRVPESPTSHGDSNAGAKHLADKATELGRRASMGTRNTRNTTTTVARRRSARRSGKEQDWPVSTTKATNRSHDEQLDHDSNKENRTDASRAAAPCNNRRLPLGVVVRRQVRLSGNQPVSDDELGM